MKNSITINKEKIPRLSLKQRLFCQHYVETMGNGTEAVIRAGYNVSKKNDQPDRNLAKSIASENLTKPNILKYINTLLSKAGLNDKSVALHHWFLINQFSNLSVKIKAIDLYYKISGAYNPTKYDHNLNLRLEAELDRMSKILPK